MCVCVRERDKEREREREREGERKRDEAGGCRRASLVHPVTEALVWPRIEMRIVIGSLS